MRAVIQRVSRCCVKVDQKTVGTIGWGVLILLGISCEDALLSTIDLDNKIKKMLDKIINLRIYEDEDGKLNKSMKDIDGELMIVSNFTVYGDAKKGTRPSYTNAASPSIAKEIYDKFIIEAKNKQIKNVQCGIFGADMKVDLLNDGPVTIVYDL